MHFFSTRDGLCSQIMIPDVSAQLLHFQPVRGRGRRLGICRAGVMRSDQLLAINATRLCAVLMNGALWEMWVWRTFRKTRTSFM